MPPAALPDTLQTPRLTLRAPQAEDAQALFDAYTQDAEVTRYLVWRPHASVDETHAFMAHCIALWHAGPDRPYVITNRSDGRPIGMLAVRLRGHIANIGYVLARSHWGQGLMPEMVREATAAALRLPQVFRVEATCDVDNRPSARVLEKSGFVREGRLARYTVHPNIAAEPSDCFIYAVGRP